MHSRFGHRTAPSPERRSAGIREGADEPSSPETSGRREGFGGRDERRPGLPIALALMVATLIVYGRSIGFSFLGYDDPVIIVDNPVVRKGLSIEGLHWVLRGEHNWNYHPLTWFSHMLDCELYGLDPRLHHLTNVILHVVNVELVWLVLRAATGSTRRSAVVALLFAVHPLNAEVVSWLAARKDLLSACFALLTLWLYLAYVRRPRLGIYLAMAVVFAAGLLSKEMLVTLPFVMLVLDVWPLERARARSRAGGVPWWRLLLEKVPLLAMAALASGAVASRQARIGAVRDLADLALWERVANAVVAYATYLRRVVWPSDLAGHYLHPYLAGGQGLSAAELGAALLILMGLTAGVVLGRRHLYLGVGWLWFLGTLVPVIGLVQIGTQAMADRYFYLPGIGLFLALVWGATDLARHWPARTRRLGAALSGVTVAALMLVNLAETGRFRDSTSFWAHTVERAPRDPHVQLNTGLGLRREGALDEAIEHMERAVELEPDHVSRRHYLGSAYVERGDLERAAEQFRAGLALAPNDAGHHLALGFVLQRQGRIEPAIDHLEQALAHGSHPAAATQLGWILATRPEPRPGDAARALSHAETAVRLLPDDPAALDALGAAQAANGRFEEAVRTVERALGLTLPPEHRRGLELRRGLYRARQPFRVPRQP